MQRRRGAGGRGRKVQTPVTSGAAACASRVDHKSHQNNTSDGPENEADTRRPHLDVAFIGGMIPYLPVTPRHFPGHSSLPPLPSPEQSPLVQNKA